MSSGLQQEAAPRASPTRLPVAKAAPPAAPLAARAKPEQAGGADKANQKELDKARRESYELKTKARKQQMEIDEKNEIIGVLRDELETSKEQADRLQRDNLQLVKDAKRVKFLQDENDFLQDKVASVERLESEIKRLKERLAELDFLKLRVAELEEDRGKAQEEALQFEDKWRAAELRLAQAAELDAELAKWKLFSQELETERNALQGKLLESIEQEARLNGAHKKVEEEVLRLRDLIKGFEEQQSNSLLVSAECQPAGDRADCLAELQAAPDTSIQCELDQQLERQLNDEKRNLKQRLLEKEAELSALERTNRDCRDELEANKRLIAELRQDLSCEKKIALKLTKQLSSFTKQIKSLDKNYFPMHGASKVAYAADQTVTAASKADLSLNVALRSPEVGSGNNKREDKFSSLSNGTSTSPSSSSSSSASSSSSSTSSASSFSEEEASSLEAEPKKSGARAPDSIRLGMYDKPEELRHMHCKEVTSLDNIMDKKLTFQPGDHTKGSPRPFESNGLPSSSDTALEKAVGQADEQQQAPANEMRGDTEKQPSISERIRIVLDVTSSLQQSVNAGGSRPESEAAPGALETGEVNEESSNKSQECQAALVTDATATATATATTNEASSENLARKFDLSTARRRDEDRRGAALANTLGALSLAPTSGEDEPKATRSKAGHCGQSSRSRLQEERQDHNEGARSNSFANNKSASHGDAGKQQAASLSPSSNGRSQNCSPSGGAAQRHDSGFQSINHDDSLASCTAGSTATSTGAGGATPAAGAPSKVGRELEADACPMALADRSRLINSKSGMGEVSQPSSSPCRDSTRSITPTQSSRDGRADGARASDESQKQRASANAKPLSHTRSPDRSAGLNLADKCNKSNSARLSQPKETSQLLGDEEAAVGGKLAPSMASCGAAVASNDKQRNNGPADVEEVDSDENEENTAVNYAPQTSSRTAPGNRFAGGRPAAQPGFQRNTLPSRSVNLGRSGPSSAYLDRIRASVAAITVTTSTTGTSSAFGSASGRSPSQQQQQQQQQQRAHQTNGLNCMLDHYHSDRCYSSLVTAAVQVAPDLARPAAAAASSRQLNALIDPVSHQRLLMSMLHHHHSNHVQSGAHPAAQAGAPVAGQAAYAPAGLAEQQRQQHLALLHHQHYYHHLQQMHQLHQLHYLHHQHHHQHHLRHKYQQQQQQQAVPSDAARPAAAAGCQHQQRARPLEGAAASGEPPMYTGGSQFYAPASAASFESYYANMGESGGARALPAHQRLEPAQEAAARPSPAGRANPSQRDLQQQQQLAANCSLPQIDEMNGLAAAGACQALGSPQRRPLLASPRKQPASRRASHSSDSSPSAWLNSSNLSPASSVCSSSSSSSSLNSLSASSGAPLVRASAFRRTLNECSRRQPNAERNLGAPPAVCGASLSRAGSCRYARSPASGAGSAAQARAQAPRAHPRPQQEPREGAAHMQAPLKPLQPASMRAANILSSGQQQAIAQWQSQSASRRPQVPQQPRPAAPDAQAKEAARRECGEPAKQQKRQLANNLAYIRLNDGLAFSSFRGPKRLADRISFGRAPATDGHGNGAAPGAGLVSANAVGANKAQSLSPKSVKNDHSLTGNPALASAAEQPAAASAANSVQSLDRKRRRSDAGNGAETCNFSNTNNNNNNNNNNTSSSVWFEYGCI